MKSVKRTAVKSVKSTHRHRPPPRHATDHTRPASPACRVFRVCLPAAAGRPMRARTRARAHGNANPENSANSRPRAARPSPRTPRTSTHRHHLRGNGRGNARCRGNARVTPAVTAQPAHHLHRRRQVTGNATRPQARVSAGNRPAGHLHPASPVTANRTAAVAQRHRSCRHDEVAAEVAASTPVAAPLPPPLPPTRTAACGDLPPVAVAAHHATPRKTLENRSSDTPACRYLLPNTPRRTSPWVT